jgi:hypothetical protein
MRAAKSGDSALDNRTASDRRATVASFKGPRTPSTTTSAPGWARTASRAALAKPVGIVEATTAPVHAIGAVLPRAFRPDRIAHGVCHRLPQKLVHRVTTRRGLQGHRQVCSGKQRPYDVGGDSATLHTHEVSGSSPEAPTTQLIENPGLTPTSFLQARSRCASFAAEVHQRANFIVAECWRSCSQISLTAPISGQ